MIYNNYAILKWISESKLILITLVVCKKRLMMLYDFPSSDKLDNPKPKTSTINSLQVVMHWKYIMCCSL